MAFAGWHKVASTNMGLEDIRKKLYKQDAEFEKRPSEPAAFEPGEKREDIEPKDRWQKAQLNQGISQKVSGAAYSLFSKKFFLIGGAVFFVLIVGLVVFVYWYARSSFDRAWVSIEISGPERVVSGEEIVYIVKCKNSTKVALNDAQLTFRWPEGSLPTSGELFEKMSLGSLAPQQTKEATFKGKLIGFRAVQKEISAILSYQPSKTQARFENEAVFLTQIIAVPLVLTLDFPDKVSAGQQITTALKYLNDSEAAFDNLVIKIEYPEGFVVSSTYPQPQENIWQIGRIGSKEEGKVLVTGTINGNRGDTKTFRAYLGVTKDGSFIPYAETVKSLQISLPVLSLEQTINDVSDYIANCGSILDYKIKYRNNSQIGLPSAKITLKFDTRALDFSTLKLGGRGSFDSVGSTVTWDQSNTPELELLDAGQSGELLFSVKVKDDLPIKDYSDKNFAVYSITNSSSANPPLALAGQQIQDAVEMSIKVNTKLGIESKGYYQDDLLPNSGPLPPQVGETTSYTIYWHVTNTSNDAEDVKVEATLPPSVAWLNKFKPTSTNFRYDSLNRKITWEIGNLSSGAGVLTPAKYAAFQIGLTPSAPQINEVVEIIRPTVITGRDVFTKTDLRATDVQITSELPDDPTVGWDRGRVASGE